MPASIFIFYMDKHPEISSASEMNANTCFTFYVTVVLWAGSYVY